MIYHLKIDYFYWWILYSNVLWVYVTKQNNEVRYLYSFNESYFYTDFVVDVRLKLLADFFYESAICGRLY